MEIRRNERESQRRLPLDKSTKDALADYCRRRWQAGTAKLAAREWGLTTDEARGVIAARASQTTIDKIFKRGGLLLAILIHEDVTGERLTDIIREVRGLHDDTTESVRQIYGEAVDCLFDRRAAGPADGGQPADRRAVQRRRRLG